METFDLWKQWNGMALKSRAMQTIQTWIYGSPEYKDSLIISKYYFQPFVYFWFLIFDHFPPSMVFKSSAPSGSKEGGVGWEVIGSEVCPDDPCLEKSLGDMIIIIIIFIHLPFGFLWLSLALSLSLTLFGSLWLFMAPSGSLWVSLALSGFFLLALALSLALISSQGSCLAR